MFKSFKFRLRPTDEQIILLEKHFGATRFLYNLALETKENAFKSGVSLSRFDLQKQIKDLKLECHWLKDINSQSLSVTLLDLDVAYTRFFKGKNDFPKFKKKTGRNSFNIPQRTFIRDGKLSIPKFRDGIDFVMHRPIKGIIKQSTVTKSPSGKYFVSILCDTGEDVECAKPIKDRTTVGIDLGLKSFIVSSDGQAFENPRFLKRSEDRLKFVQRKHSKHKGKRTKHKLAVLHEKIANQRKDFLHKVSSHLVKNHDSIAIENLQVSNMMKNHCLARSIQDAGWGMFVDFLKYKAKWNGVNILQIGTFEPSSKMCSNCGNVNKGLTLRDREWICGVCGITIDRDKNAAINIKNIALKTHVSGVDTKNQGELPTLVGVMTPEAT